MSVQSQEIGIDTHDVNLGTLSKAFRLATRTRLKVGRAFSFSKTPSRKRNIASPFGSNASLTPSTISSMSHLKLQSSCMTLNVSKRLLPIIFLLILSNVFFRSSTWIARKLSNTSWHRLLIRCFVRTRNLLARMKCDSKGRIFFENYKSNDIFYE